MPLKSKLLVGLIATILSPLNGWAQNPISAIQKQWTYQHSNTGVAGFTSEITAFDHATNTLWVAGVAGVDVLNLSDGSLIQHINTTSFGFVNSVAIHNGVAAFAIESAQRTQPGVVKLFDTSSRSLVSGIHSISVGALPDMLTFTPDGSKLLVANEGTPSTYGARIGTTVPRNFGSAPNDPVGSVSVIDMNTRTVVATAGFGGVMRTGTNIRTNTGMDFEPEYIAVNNSGTKAFVTLQEANAIGILDLTTNSFEKVVGLGYKDFSLPGNTIDPLNDGTISFISANVKGLYMPDGIATYEANGRTYLVMGNEGDFREDDGDRSPASSLGAIAPLNNLRILNTDSSPGDLYTGGTRSFSIRDDEGNLVFDSGDILDRMAAQLGIYNDVRSRDRGVEPEGVALFDVNGRVIAAIGLERTLKSAIALFDVTDPASASFLDMIVTEGDLSPEGLSAFTVNNQIFLSVANEVSNSTSLFLITPVPEPDSYAMLLGGIAILGWVSRRRLTQVA